MATKYTKEILEEAVSLSRSYSQVLSHLGLAQAGGTQSHIKKRIQFFDIDTSHFTGQAWSSGEALKKKSAEDILVVLSANSPRPKSNMLRRALTEVGVEYSCAICKNDGYWQGQRMTLEVDHIDGNWINNLASNLRFLCPNCHSQCETSRPWKNA